LPKTDACDFEVGLASARRALGRARLQHWVEVGGASGAVLAALVLAAAHARPFDLVLPVTAALLLVGILAGLIAGMFLWPASAETARIVDRHFALDDRMTTALQFRSSSDEIAKLQRTDTELRIRPLAIKQSRRGQVRSRESVFMASAVLGFIGLLALGGVPTSTARASPSATSQDQVRIRKVAIVSLPAIARNVVRDSSTPTRHDPILSALDLRLALLRHQLLQAQSRGSALRSISLTQLQLQRLAGSLHAVDAESIRQLNMALGRYAGQQPGAIPSADPLLTARFLKQLANSLSSLSAAERARLAQTLARTANAISDVQLRSYLRQAASSLAYNDPPSASHALQKAASFVGSTPRARIAARNLKAVNRQLETLKNKLLGTAKPGQRSGTGSARLGRGNNLNSQARRNGDKSASRPSVPGRGSTKGGGPSSLDRLQHRNLGAAPDLAGPNGKASAGGKVTGLSFRRAGEGRQVTDISPIHNANTNAKGATIYVPGVQGRGPHAVQLGANGAPLAGQLVPYRQVVVQYTRSAHQALDRAALPPALQSYVRRYFDQLTR